MGNVYYPNDKCPLYNRCWLPYGNTQCENRLEGYELGRRDKEKQIRDKMVQTSYGLGTYLTISEEDWEQIKNK